jgi:hypothetical protein
MLIRGDQKGTSPEKNYQKRKHEEKEKDLCRLIKKTTTTKFGKTRKTNWEEEKKKKK